MKIKKKLAPFVKNQIRNLQKIYYFLKNKPRIYYLKKTSYLNCFKKEIYFGHLNLFRKTRKFNEDFWYILKRENTN